MTIFFASVWQLCNLSHPSIQRPTRAIYLLLLLTLIGLWPAAWACTSSDIRYASSTNRIYIEQPVTCTLTDLTAKAPTSALELVDAGAAVWLLRANILLKNGGRLDLHSTEIGGDVNELRLVSNPGLDGFIYIQPNYGILDIDGPLITSWDETTGGPDLEHSDGRSHIKARSFLDAGGIARESTVNVNNAELAYLGYSASESYGLVLKVKAKRFETEIFDQVDIFGKLTNSYVHDNYMGFYSWGAYGMQIDNNQISGNISYGIDPHDNSDYLSITNNHVHDNGNHGIICSQHCDHLTITGNTVERNRHGIMLHRSVTDSLIENNTVLNNRSDGIALYESSFNTVRNNRVEGNANGIRCSMGSSDNVIEYNSVSGNVKHGLYLYQGNDVPEVGDGRNRNNVFQYNDVDDSSEGLRLTDSDGNTFINNNFTGTAPFKFYQAVDNIFGSNSIAGALEIHSKGDSVTHSSTIADIDQPALVRINADGDLTLKNAQGRVLAPEELGVEIVIKPSGTEFNLNTSNIGSKSNVSALDLWVRPQTSSIGIIDPVWQTTKSWLAKPASDFVVTEFTVGDLSPAMTHTVRKGGAVLLEQVSDSNGQITFTDTLASAGTEYVYTVQAGDAGSNPTIIDVTPGDDAYVRGGQYADNVYGTGNDVQVKNKGVDNDYTREGFFKFDLSGHAVPNRAVLRLATKLSSTDAATVQIAAVADTTWDENTLAYANKPSSGSVLGSYSVANTSYQYYDVDVTDYIIAEKQAGRDVVSFIATAMNPTRAVVKIGSKDASSNRPVLELEY